MQPKKPDRQPDLTILQEVFTIGRHGTEGKGEVCFWWKERIQTNTISQPGREFIFTFDPELWTYIDYDEGLTGRYWYHKIDWWDIYSHCIIDSYNTYLLEEAFNLEGTTK